MSVHSKLTRLSFIAAAVAATYLVTPAKAHAQTYDTTDPTGCTNPAAPDYQQGDILRHYPNGQCQDMSIIPPPSPPQTYGYFNNGGNPYNGGNPNPPGWYWVTIPAGAIQPNGKTCGKPFGGCTVLEYIP